MGVEVMTFAEGALDKVGQTSPGSGSTSVSQLPT